MNSTRHLLLCLCGISSMLAQEFAVAQSSASLPGTVPFDEMRHLDATVSGTYGLEDQYGYALSLDQGIAAVGAPGNSGPGGAYLFENVNGSWLERLHIPSPIEIDGHEYGSAIAFDDGHLLVGAPVNGPTSPTEPGSVWAYHYDRTTDLLSAPTQIQPAGISVFSDYGRTLALDGPYAAIGDEDIVYMYERDIASGIWHEIQQLTPPQGINSGFGLAISIDGDGMAIGARNAVFNMNQGGGAVNIYVRDPGTGQWVLEQTVVASNASQFDQFGGAVNLSGTRLLIGAPQRFAPTSSGSAYVFERDAQTGSWSETHEFSFSAPRPSQAGFSVYQENNTALIGAPGAIDSGNLTVFQYNPTTGLWTEQQRLEITGSPGRAKFGFSVAIEDDTILGGAPEQRAPDEKSGALYAYEYDAAQMNWSDDTLVGPAEGAAGDELSRSISISDEWLIAGAPMDDDQGINSGSVSIYRKAPNGSWQFHSKILAQQSTTQQQFGHSVSLHGDLLAVGVPRYLNGGKVKVFRHDAMDDQWHYLTDITPSVSDSSGLFGDAVDLWESTLVVGAVDFRVGGDRTGGVFVFTLDAMAGTSTEDAFLLPSSLSGLTKFGSHVALENGTLAVGSSRGSYVFTFNETGLQWEQTTELLDGMDRVGPSVALSGDRIVVGTPGRSDYGTAHVFERDVMQQWILQSELSPDDGLFGDNFGSSVAVDGDRIIIGAERQSSDDPSRGAAYLFVPAATPGSWALVDKFTPRQSRAMDRNGHDVAIFGADLAIGSLHNDGRGNQSGAVFTYNLDILFQDGFESQ